MRLPRLVAPMALMMVMSLGGAIVVTLNAEAALGNGKSALVSAGSVKAGTGHRKRGHTSMVHSSKPTPRPIASTWTTDTTASPTTSPTAEPSPTPTTSQSASTMGAEITEQVFTYQTNAGTFTTSYCTNGNLDRSWTGVTNAVIVVHGDSRTACDQARYIVDAASDRGQLQSTLVIAPHFLTIDDADAAQPNRLYWSDGGWKSGSQSLTSPYARSATVSSYAVMDAMVAATASNAVLPNLQHLVIAGHSAGGQFVNRYAATTHLAASNPGLAPHYVVANPSSYLYFDARRPDGDQLRALTSSEVNACSSFNDYKYGLNKMYSYPAGSLTPAPQQYSAARVTYLLGELDTDPNDPSLDTTCAAEWQGANRLQRGRSYFRALGETLGAEVYDRHDLMTVPGVGHSAHGMLASPVGAAVLFP